MWFVNTCLIQRTKYSVSASVSCTGSEDLNNGPKLLNSGMAASCSARKGQGDRHLATGSFLALTRPAANPPNASSAGDPPVFSPTLKYILTWRCNFLRLAGHQGNLCEEKNKDVLSTTSRRSFKCLYISNKTSLACGVSHILLQTTATVGPYTHWNTFSATQCLIVRRDVWVIMNYTWARIARKKNKQLEEEGQKTPNFFLKGCTKSKVVQDGGRKPGKWVSASEMYFFQTPTN